MPDNDYDRNRLGCALAMVASVAVWVLALWAIASRM